MGGMGPKQLVIQSAANGFIVSVNYEKAYVFNDWASTMDFLGHQDVSLLEVTDGSIHKL